MAWLSLWENKVWVLNWVAISLSDSKSKNDEGNKENVNKTQPKKADENKNIFLFEIDDLNFPKNEKLSSHQDLFLKASFNHKKAIVQNVNSKITH